MGVEGSLERHEKANTSILILENIHRALGACIERRNNIKRLHDFLNSNSTRYQVTQRK